MPNVSQGKHSGRCWAGCECTPSLCVCGGLQAKVKGDIPPLCNAHD